MLDTPEQFIRKTITSAFILSFGICVLFIGGIMKSLSIVMISFPICYLLLFNYLIKVPDVKINEKEKGISREIVFASRFLMIEIESGVPIYNAFINVSNV